MWKMTFMKLRVLLWKHFLVRWRCFVMTGLELAVPISIVLILRITYTKFSRPPTNIISSAHHTDPFSDYDLYQGTSINNIYYAPNESDFIRNLMADVSAKLSLGEKGLVGFNDETTLFQKKEKSLKIDQESLAVIFENTQDIPSIINYTIRTSKEFHTSKIIPSAVVPGPHENYGRIYFSFVTLQLAIDSSYIEKISNRTLTKNLMIQPYPYPPYAKEDFLIIKYDYLIPIFIINCFLFLFLVNISRVLTEKGSGMKELMKMMGVPKNLLWLSHYINSMVIQFIVVVSITCTLRLGNIPLIVETNIIILGVSLLLFANYVTMMSFAVTTIFSKSLIACIVASVLWILFQLSSGYSYSALNSLFFSVILSINPNILVFWMFKIIGIYEMGGDGLQWNNFFSLPSDEVSICFGFVWLMLFLQSILFVFFTWYMDQVNPGAYGVPKSKFFLFKRDYWCSKQIDPQIDLEEKEDNHSNYFEPHPATAEAGVTIDNVWKVYKSRNQSNVQALSGVSFSVYRGGITALLGHNGAGKTTLMSIITGMISPTRGTVKVNGLDTKKNMDEIRHSIGVCPQHNLTFPNLTVREHIIFFAKIKGISHAVAVRESDDILASVKLSGKSNKMCGQLSCGMRRRAQLAMALVAKASVLILDEPTSGLDPESRRELWDILLKFKESHTILMSTHSLEEADVLADRVVIMNHGRLKCYGTSMFLKKAYGTGYKLYLVLESAETEILSRIETSFKGMSISCSKMENVVVLNIPEQSKDNFQHIFTLLEQHKEQWGIDTIGLSSTTLEDVFLRVTNESEATETVEPGENNSSSTLEINTAGTQETDTKSTFNLTMNRMEGLVKKRMIHTKISGTLFIVQIVFVILFSCIFLLDTKDNHPIDDNPKLSLNLLAYRGQIGHVPYSTNGTGQKDFSAFDKFYHTRFEQIEDAYTGVLQKGEESIKSFLGSMPIALDLSNDSYIGLYSTSLYHALPVAVNTFTNLLATEMAPGHNRKPAIFVNNHPIKIDPLEDFEKNMGKSLMSIMVWSGSLTIGASIMLAIFMPFPINERKSCSRKLQQMTGTSPILYWLITIVYDAVICLAISFIVILIVCLFDPDDTLSISETSGVLLVLLTCHIFAGLSFVYMLSLHMKNSSIGYIFLLIIAILGMLVSLILFLERMIMSSMKSRSNTLSNILCLLPCFSFNQGLLKIGITASQNAVCHKKFPPNKDGQTQENLCCAKNDVTGACIGLKNYFTDEEYGIDNELCFFAISTTVYMLILMVSEYRVMQKALSGFIKQQYTVQDNTSPDNDVLMEKSRMGHGDTKVALRIEDLVKQYRTMWSKDKVLAVNGVTIGINKGECFGLLGVNGAGKTTIFKMLVGEETPTMGTITGRSNGYCPEFDAVDKFLTGREVLTLFCRLRGMSKQSTIEEVNNMLKMTGLTRLANVQNGKYSGGNRRKLSVAIALIANHTGVVLLDEPTSGVDPHSRRVLHRALSNARKQGRSIIISSHSMDECEKLCDRLAIMSNGRLACIGNVQHLKKKFGQGVSLTLKLKIPSEDSEGTDEVDSMLLGEASEQITKMADLYTPLYLLKESIDKAFECELKGENMMILQYHIKNIGGYTNLFSKMEEIKHNNPNLLEDYMINDTTLEEVFMFIAKSNPPLVNPDTNVT